MNIKNLWEDFEKTYLFVGDTREGKWVDTKISKIDIMNSFSIFVNYNSNVCIHILKDKQLINHLWREILIKYDLTKLYLRENKLFELI